MKNFIMLDNIAFLMKNFRTYLLWKMIKKGFQSVVFKRGCGNYFPIGLIGYEPAGKVERLNMESGKVAICELIDYEIYTDQIDMIKESYWHFRGYEGLPMMKDCSFRQFVNYYECLKSL